MDKFEIDNILKITKLKDELELERATAFQNKLRWMIKEDSSLEPLRNHLRNLIEEYEIKNWSDEDNVSDEQIFRNDKAFELAELENKFLQKRKEYIKKALLIRGLTQQDLAKILGHRKNYMSELMNGVRPFSKTDVIVIHRLLKIKLEYLIPLFIKDEIVSHIKEAISELNKPNLKLSKTDFDLVLV